MIIVSLNKNDCDSATYYIPHSVYAMDLTEESNATGFNLKLSSAGPLHFAINRSRKAIEKGIMNLPTKLTALPRTDVYIALGFVRAVEIFVGIILDRSSKESYMEMKWVS